MGTVAARIPGNGRRLLSGPAGTRASKAGVDHSAYVPSACRRTRRAASRSRAASARPSSGPRTRRAVASASAQAPSRCDDGRGGEAVGDRLARAGVEDVAAAPPLRVGPGVAVVARGGDRGVLELDHERPAPAPGPAHSTATRQRPPSGRRPRAATSPPTSTSTSGWPRATSAAAMRSAAQPPASAETSQATSGRAFATVRRAASSAAAGSRRARAGRRAPRPRGTSGGRCDGPEAPRLHERRHRDVEGPARELARAPAELERRHRLGGDREGLRRGVGVEPRDLRRRVPAGEQAVDEGELAGRSRPGPARSPPRPPAPSPPARCSGCPWRGRRRRPPRGAAPACGRAPGGTAREDRRGEGGKRAGAGRASRAQGRVESTAFEEPRGEDEDRAVDGEAQHERGRPPLAQVLQQQLDPAERHQRVDEPAQLRPRPAPGGERRGRGRGRPGPRCGARRRPRGRPSTARPSAAHSPTWTALPRAKTTRIASRSWGARPQPGPRSAAIGGEHRPPAPPRRGRPPTRGAEGTPVAWPATARAQATARPVSRAPATR